MERRMGRQPPSPPHAAAGHHEAPAVGQASDTMSAGERRLVAIVAVPTAVEELTDVEFDVWLEARYADIVARIQQGGSPSAKGGPAA